MSTIIHQNLINKVCSRPFSSPINDSFGLKKNLFAGLLSLSLGALASCQSSKTEGSAAAFGTCAAESATVRTVADAKGTLYLAQASKQYRIHAAQAGTVDVVDVGVVCGTLPQALQVTGKPVVFSGTYKTYANPPSAPGGTTYYYLELTKLQLQ